jgi:hypothetical protein
MKRKTILKEAGVLLIAMMLFLTAVTVTANTKDTKEMAVNTLAPVPVTRAVLFEDGFESYGNFVLDFPPWIQYDGDGAATYGMTNYDYPNEYYTGSYIIFNPSQTTPPCPDAPPHSGDKFAACFNAVLPASNDDWLITPKLTSTEFDDVSFWARVYTDAYNLDRFQVGISTTGTDPADFTIISPSPYIEATITWTQYTYDLSSYSGDIYIAIHCVSNDAFILMIDDFVVTTTGVAPEPAICCEGSLTWSDVKPGTSVNGTFTVSNCGEPGSLLNWEVSSFPLWGTWTIVPESGTGLAEGDSVTVAVQVVAPSEKKKEFTGKIKLINSDNPDDFCEVDVVLVTPTKQDISVHLFFERLFERFPNAFPLLRHLMGC